MRTRVTLPRVAALALTLALAGCGSTATDEARTTQRGGDSRLTIPTCTGEQTLPGRPKAVVTANTAALELMIRLGAADRVVGTGWSSGAATLPADVRPAATRVRSLGTRAIPKETLLTSGADAYVDAFGTMRMMGGDAPTASDYAAAGISHVVLRSTACADARPTPQTSLADVFGDIGTLGRVTGQEKAARGLVEEMREEVTTARRRAGLPDVDPAAAEVATPADAPSIFYYAPETARGQVVTVGSRQVGQAVLTLAGLRNVFGDREGAMVPVSWEEVIAADPDWIQVAVRRQPSAEAQRAAEREAVGRLRDDPRTSGLRAVRDGRLIVLGAEDTTLPGVENARAVSVLAGRVHGTVAATSSR